MTAPGRLCCKSLFAPLIKNFPDRRRDIRVNRARGNRIQPQQRPADGLRDDGPQAGVAQPAEGRRHPCVARNLAGCCQCERGILLRPAAKAAEPRGRGHGDRGAAVGDQRAAVRGLGANLPEQNQHGPPLNEAASMRLPTSALVGSGTQTLRGQQLMSASGTSRHTAMS